MPARRCLHPVADHVRFPVLPASGAASEQMVGHLERHLATWPQLRPGTPVTGGVLVINHQHRLHPSERTAQVYSRPEFVATLRVAVVSTLELFHWWRAENWAAIQDAILGTAAASAATAAERSAGLATPTRRPPWWRPSGQTR
jgi:hypothetical protein